MKLQSNEQIFNLYDTNGRRSDVLNAYKIYLRIIKDLKINLHNPWAAYPNSLNQYRFYKRAVNDSVGIFKEHPQFDHFENYLKKHTDFNKKFHSLDSSLDFTKPVYTNKNNKEYTLGTILDNGIESRARHYTNSLSNMGFVNNNRELTPAGKALLAPSEFDLDLLEKSLNLAPDNILMLRQILKVRIYNKNGNCYYSPGKFALYLILKKFKDVDIYKVSNFMKLIQLVSPTGKYTINKIENHLKNHGFNDLLFYLIRKGNIDKSGAECIESLGDKKIPKKDFENIFTNRKSSSTIDIYFSFYKILCDFIESGKCQKNYCNLKRLFSNSKSKDALKKAFGYGKSIFKIKSKTLLKDFLANNHDHELLTCTSFRELNQVFYNCFILSKTKDRLKENISETKYLLEATGLFKTKSGTISIRNQDFFENKEIISNLREDILNSEYFQNYESGVSSPFGELNSLTEILKINENDVKKQIESVVKKYNLHDADSLDKYLEKKKDKEFNCFVKKTFPKDKVFNLLNMFKDRNNDEKIRNRVTNQADIPTIFEYISGLAWYYLSDKQYSLMDSFRLTLDANFLPLTHAGGGDGDIIINYKDYIIMIEATLMNKQAQKRGEWEPVLRHSANLSIDSDKPSTTLFLADDLDSNTINIWRAVATIPLESSNHAGKFTNSVVKIMPLKIDDFITFSKDLNFTSKKLIQAIDDSYTSLKNKSFDTKWREEIIENSCKINQNAKRKA